MNQQKSREQAAEARRVQLQQLQEHQKKQIEELRRKQAEEAEKKVGEQNRWKQEQTAILTVRRSFLKLRGCTDDNFATIQQEISDTLAAQLPACGEFQGRLQEEAIKAQEKIKAQLE